MLSTRLITTHGNAAIGALWKTHNNAQTSVLRLATWFTQIGTNAERHQ
jgi:hypothetical protein